MTDAQDLYEPHSWSWSAANCPNLPVRDLMAEEKLLTPLDVALIDTTPGPR